MGSYRWTTFAVISLIAARVTAEADCPEGRAAEKLLLHFQQDAPRGLPGLDLPPWMPLMTPLQVGPVTLLDTRARGLNDLVLHDLHVLAHNFTGSVKLSLPMLVVEGVYEIPGLWWTTTGHFNLTLTNISADTTISIAVLSDGCFYVYDYQTNMTRGSFSYSTDGLLDDAGMLDIFFDDLFDLLLDLTKPTILAFANHQIRRGLTNFLPPNGTANSSSMPSTSLPPSLDPSEPIPPNTMMYDDDHLQSLDDHSSSQDELSTEGNLLTFDDHLLTPEELPSPEEQVAALVRFVSYQIEWMIGDPLYLPNITLNIIGIAELHNMSVNHLKQVTQVQHLALDFDGEFFSITTQMLHSNVFNRHRVLWFPGAVFRTWQWTEAQLGLVKHRAVLTLHRQLLRPQLAEFSARPVVFNPDHASAGVRRMDRWARRLMDGMRTSFGDSIKALFYSPIVKNVQRVLNSLDTLTLVKQFVCYAAGHH